MRLIGFLLLLSGWGLVLAALGMLPAGGARSVFALAGAVVEIVGLALAVRAHIPLKNDRIPRPPPGVEALR